MSSRMHRLRPGPNPKVLSVVITGTLSLGSAVAHSQELQEVTVTAQRREQNIQNVPIAITAFTADTIRERNLTDLNSLSNLTPNVNLDASAPFSGDSSVLSLWAGQGVAQGRSSPAAELVVALEEEADRAFARSAG